MKDLFGRELTHAEATRPTSLARKCPIAYAAPPGTGPAGETCRSCAHYCRIHYHDKTYRKCGRIKHLWTHGPGTDIKASSPACHEWKPKETAK